MTPQGRAIKQAAIDFGNGQTLPFTPCKKGYIPILGDGRRVVACPLHNDARKKRLAKEGGKFRKGEVDLNIFWSKQEASDTTDVAVPDESSGREEKESDRKSNREKERNDPIPRNRTVDEKQVAA
jgi:hypothetical protein